MRRISRSSDDIKKLSDELDLSEEILSENVDGATETTINKAWRCIERHVSLLDVFKMNIRNIDIGNNQIGNTFAKKRRSLTTPSRTRLSLRSSAKFPIEAFMVDNSTEFSNPDVFSEVYPMAFISASIFALAEVRQAARNGNIDNEDLDIVSTPVTTGAILKAFGRNQSFFQSQLKSADYDFLLSLARNTDIDADMDTSEDTISNAEDGDQKRKKKALALINSLSIEYFGDDNTESECMYMITRSPMSKRITLIFRGSITLQDWIKDSKVVVSGIENPVADRPNQLPMIGVHLGFREYLYGESRSISTALPDNHDETATAHKVQRGSTTVVTEEDEIEILIEPECGNRDTEDNESVQNIDISAGDENDSATHNGISEFVTSKQEGEKSTFDLLNYLGMDLSTIKEKHKSLWTSMKWNGTPSLSASEKDEIVTTDFLPKFTAPKNRTKNKSRLARILDEILHLQRQYDNYRIYVTGHSLGGALGLLAALEIAERFGKKEQPVTFVGIANPRAGTEGFRDAVELLEREGKMRCISIHGRFDVVSMLPNSTFINRGTKRRFCQSGFELLLNSESGKFYMRRSERNDEKYMQRMGLALFRADRIGERHHFITYLKELEALERPLHKLYLNDFYDKFVEQSLFPCSEKKMTPMKVRAGRGRQSVAVVRVPSKRELRSILSADDLHTKDETEKSFEII